MAYKNSINRKIYFIDEKVYSFIKECYEESFILEELNMYSNNKIGRINISRNNILIKTDTNVVANFYEFKNGSYYPNTTYTFSKKYSKKVRKLLIYLYDNYTKETIIKEFKKIDEYIKKVKNE